MKQKLLCLLCAALTVTLPLNVHAEEAAALPDWEEWHETTILVGNERDGFNDSVQGRIVFSNPKANNGHFYPPYLAKAPDEERVLLMIGSRKLLESTDEGETWHDPVPKGNRGIDGWGLAAGPNGLLLATDGHYRSVDRGATWEAKEGFPTDPRFGTALYGWHPILIDPKSEGGHLIGTLAFVRDFEFADARMEPLITESVDGGKTWDTPRGVPEWSGANEVCLAYNAKGEIVAALRVHTIAAAVNDEYDRLDSSWSADGGRTWTRPKVVAGNGRHHPSMALLPDGRMVMSYVVRMGYEDIDGKYAYGIEAVLSNDGGHTWDTDHRYILSRWTHDCIVPDEQGNRVQVDRWLASPTNTSTIYLPQSGCLLTAYGTRQHLDRMVGGKTLPWQSALIKWKPLDSYSDVKASPPPPIPAEEALRQLRANYYWSYNYVAATGLPDAGWCNIYPELATSCKGEWLRLDNRSSYGFYSARGIEGLEMANGSVGMRLRLNIPTDDDPKPARLNIYAVVGSGQDRHVIHLGVDKEANLFGGTFGTVDLPAKQGTSFLLEFWMDPRSRCYRLWIDGQLVKETIQPVKYKAPEDPAVFYFGSGAQNVGGFVDIAELKFGAVRSRVGKTAAE